MEDFVELGLLVMVFVLSGQYLTYTARISVPLWRHIITRPWPAADCGQEPQDKSLGSLCNVLKTLIVSGAGPRDGH